MHSIIQNIPPDIQYQANRGVSHTGHEIHKELTFSSGYIWDALIQKLNAIREFLIDIILQMLIQLALI